MIKDGVGSCQWYLTCFTANFAVRGSLRCGISSCFGLPPPKRIVKPAIPTLLV